jgi:uncharacterized protein YjhX (UPF0386 family)
MDNENTFQVHVTVPTYGGGSEVITLGSTTRLDLVTEVSKDGHSVVTLKVFQFLGTKEVLSAVGSHQPYEIEDRRMIGVFQRWTYATLEGDVKLSKENK